jgi:hypothetical protein
MKLYFNSNESKRFSAPRYRWIPGKTDVKRSFGLRMVGLVLMLGFAGVLRADDSPFAYTYTTDSLPKGAWEYEQWNTLHSGKAAGTYQSFALDQEIEHGFTDNFQASFYLHSSYLYTHDTPNPDDTSTNLESQSSYDINGVSVEMKYRLLSPYKDPIGLTLYLEPELGVREALTGEDMIERALEAKLILQKNFFDDRLVLAANAVFEPEWEREEDTRSKELKNEYLLAAAYRFTPAWSAGLELDNRRLFADQDFSKQEASAFFLGPAFHYSTKGWWASFTILPQIAGTPRALGLDADGNPVSDSYRHLGEYEKLEMRLKFGIAF